MDFKKIFSAGILAAIIFFAPSLTFAAESATDKLIQIEQETYGAEQTGAILNRISRLEKDYDGRNMQGNMNARIDAIYDSIYENLGQPGVATRVNALEWNVDREVHSGGIKNRVTALETKIFGSEKDGSLTSRIRDLSKASFGSENIPMMQMQLPANTLVKVELTESISSRTLQAGDKVTVKVAEDVITNGKLIFAKGLLGEGTVKSVRKAKGWTGRNGKVDIEFENVRTIDGKSIETLVGEEAKQKMIDEQKVAGASLVAMNINDDWNKFMVHGKNVEITAGTQLYIQTKNPVTVYVLDANAQDSLLTERSSTNSRSIETVEELDSAITYTEDD